MGSTALQCVILKFYIVNNLAIFTAMLNSQRVIKLLVLV